MKTKFYIGQRVYICHQHDDMEKDGSLSFEAITYTTPIIKIQILKNGIYYMVDGLCKEYKENEIFATKTEFLEFLEKNIPENKNE